MRHKEMAELMGKVVVASKVLRRLVEHRKARWIEIETKERPGWIVGFRRVQIGEIHFGWGGDDPTTFNQTGTVPCILISYWPTMKPVKVPLDGYRLAEENEKPYSNAYKWTDRDRKQYAEDAKKYATRDKKGRFVKWG